MTHFTIRRGGRKQAAYVMAALSVLFLTGVSFAQTVQSSQAGPLRPNLGTAATYAIFTGAGAINNTGLSKLTGDVGQDGAYAFNGFFPNGPGTYTGVLNRNNGASAQAKSDLLNAWTVEAAVANDLVLGVGIADAQSFDPKVYHSGGASTTTGNITFDAHGDATAIFIVKIGGQLSANAGTHILLANGAVSTNIYWFVDGAVNIANNCTMKGIIVARGAISFLGTSSLDGRALTTAGAINLAANSMGPVPPGQGNDFIVIHPAQGDTIKGGMQNYQITWTGSGITSKKIFEFSLDSGLSWKTIDTVTADVFGHNWNVPDTVSKQALVRITDGNNLKAVSGLFTIASGKSPNPDSLIVVHPALAEIITGGTPSYQIIWTGTGIASQKIFEFSLDNGLTWKTIDTISADIFAHSWNVPDTASTLAIIRITDKNGITGKSGVFTIKSSKPNQGSIVVIHPLKAEVIDGGTQSFLITFTEANTTAQKTFEYSLDGGANWILIGLQNSDVLTYTWANVPNVATTQALVRITDANGTTGTSGIFTIKVVAGIGSINSLTLNPLVNNNIGNGKTLNISWTFTPDIGKSVIVEVSLDTTRTWQKIADNPITAPQTSWTTKNTGYFYPVYVRVTSTLGMTLTSIPFSIGSNASVSSWQSENGYSVSNYPNPAGAQTMINFVLPAASDVNLTIIDGLGREIEALVSQRYQAGTYNIPFDASKLSMGMYTYILQAGATRLTGKMSIVR